MARYLLVEFDDNDSADRMRAQIDAATEAGKGFRIAGLFAVPTQWCTCPKSDGYHKDEVVRGSRLGWWVHRLCRKARLGSHQLANLIKPSDRAYAREAGYVELVDSISVHEVAVQNIT